MDEAWRGKEPLPGLGEEGGRRQPGEGCADAVESVLCLALGGHSPSQP